MGRIYHFSGKILKEDYSLMIFISSTLNYTLTIGQALIGHRG